MRILSLFGRSASRKIAARNYTSVPERLVNVTKNDSTGVAVVSMVKPPVNSLDLKLLSSLKNAVERLKQEECPGIVLSSDCPTVFSAGLDLKELHRPDPIRLKTFWRTLQDVWYALYTFPQPVVAAINGHSPAGGCLLALACDYRVMVKRKFIIGLNETKVGMVPPFWLQDSMRNVVGEREAERALMSGRLYTADEALAVGLIDDIATDKADAESKAEEFVDAQSYLPAVARRLTKVQYREDTVKRFLKHRDEDVSFYVEYLSRPQVQETIATYLEAMKKH